MDFAWEELTPAQRARHYADWHAGKGLIGGDPRQRPNSETLPSWAMERSFVRALALDDCRAVNGERFRHQTAGPHPLEIEIGFGRGDFLLDRAARWPERWFVGLEVRTKAGRLAPRRLGNQRLENLWLSDDDARVGLQLAIPDRRVEAVHVLVPDPWWKAQHKVKRLFSPPFVDLLAAGVASARDLRYFQFFTNAFGTTSQGVDVVSTWTPLALRGNTVVSAAFNYTRTEVTDNDRGLLNARRTAEYAYALPRTRWNAAVTQRFGPTSLLGRVSYYGGWYDYVSRRIPANAV